LRHLWICQTCGPLNQPAGKQPTSRVLLATYVRAWHGTSALTCHYQFTIASACDAPGARLNKC
jgi:hypothetical protein